MWKTLGLARHSIGQSPYELIEICERFVIEMGVSGVNQTGVPLVFLPLHEGADGLMSNTQFERSYWPTLKEVMLGLMEEGCIPVMFAEGSYNQRLEIVANLTSMSPPVARSARSA